MHDLSSPLFHISSLFLLCHFKPWMTDEQMSNAFSRADIPTIHVRALHSKNHRPDSAPVSADRLLREGGGSSEGGGSMQFISDPCYSPLCPGLQQFFHFCSFCTFLCLFCLCVPLFLMGSGCKACVGSPTRRTISR